LGAWKSGEVEGAVGADHSELRSTGQHKEICRTYGACRIFGWDTQRSRAGLTSFAPPALGERRDPMLEVGEKFRIFPCRVHKKN
jgi:hypothetical protein